MLTIKVNNETYRAPSAWEEITLAQAAKAEPVVRALTPEERELYTAGKVTGATANREFEEGLIKALTGMGDEEVAQIGGNDRRMLVAACACVVQVCAGGYADIGDIAGFNFRGNRYAYPTSGLDVAGNTTPLSGVTALRLCMVMDIAALGTLSAAPLLVAAMVSNDISVDALRTLSRTFDDLPMVYYWRASALLYGAHEYLRREFAACYYTGGTGGTSTGGTPPTWDDRLVYVAGNVESLPYVEAMPAYEFMRVLNAKLKDEINRWRT